MRVGVPRETAPGERRVALVPESIRRLTGVEVVVETGAGAAAGADDDAFRDTGATIGDPWAADVVAKVGKPSPEEGARLQPGTVLIGFLQPLTDAQGIERRVDHAESCACGRRNRCPVGRVRASTRLPGNS